MLSCQRGLRGECDDDFDLKAYKLRGQFWQLVELALRPAELEGNVLALDIAESFKPFRKKSNVAGGLGHRTPMRGIFFRGCACAGSGHTAAAPPSSVMNARRF